MNSRRHRFLSRRGILRGAGVCLSLPWLESLLPRARAQQVGYPRRFLTLFFPNGAAEQWWAMNGEPGSVGWQLSPVLQPFAPLQSKLVVLDGLGNHRWLRVEPQIFPSHSRLTAAFLSCADIRGDAGQQISLDQLIAQYHGVETALPSLQLGLATTPPSSCEGDPCAFSTSISYDAQGQALPKRIDPQDVFDLLFGVDSSFPSPADQAEWERQRALHVSVLDYVLESALAFEPRLGEADRQRVDQFLNSVRETELRLQQLRAPLACSPPERPTLAVTGELNNGDQGYDRATHATLMNDLIVLALQCDATRVVSHMLDDARSQFVYDHVPQQDFGGDSAVSVGDAGFYSVTASGADANAYASINHWLNSVAADLCLKLDAVPEGDSTLLDHSVVFYGSNFHGAAQDAARIPALLLGGGQGTLRTGQYLDASAILLDAQFRDLFATLLSGCFQISEPFGLDFAGLDAREVPGLLL